MILLCLLAVFEFNSAAGPASAMVAGGALFDWRGATTANPALASTTGRLDAAVSYERPYALAGLAHVGAQAGVSVGRVAIVAVASDLGLADYHETDLGIAVATGVLQNGTFGIGAHALTVRSGGDVEFAPVLDAGGCWDFGRVRIAASCMRLNGPRIGGAGDLASTVMLSASWQPVDDLTLAADLVRDGSDEELRLGGEFRIIPALGLRAGIGTAPLRYAAGVAADAGPLTFDYAFHLHPVLGGSHRLGLLFSLRPSGRGRG
jgi:hypothetical protein